MRKLLLILILTFNFQIPSTADDITSFEIEGMSVGDSLIDHFSKKKINKSKVNWYDSLEKNTVTLRDRDTGEQNRCKISDLPFLN